jgi:outer membrane receptor protein involved in Fe transport
MVAGAALLAAPAQAATLSPLQVTAGRGAALAAETVGAVSVVDAEALALRPATTWTEALRGEAGVFLQSSGPGQGIVILRGLKGSEVLHLVDGFRFNNSFFRNAPSQYLALVDPLRLQRIEVLRGAASGLYGSDALGGVVQLITEAPRIESETWAWRGGLRSGVDSAQQARSARLTLAGGDRQFQFSAGLSHADYGARDAGGAGRLPFSAYTAHGEDLQLDWRPDAVQDWQLDLSRYTQPSTPRHHELVAGFGAAPESALAEFAPNARHAARLRYRHLAPPGLDRLELQLGRQVLIDDRQSRALGETVTQFEFNRSRLDGLSLLAERGLGERLRWRGGAEANRDHIDSRRLRVDDTGVSDVPARFPDGAQTRSRALWSLLEGQWARDWRWEASLRYGRDETRLPAAPERPGVTVGETAATGTVGLLWAFRPEWRWNAQLGRGFRAPNVFDLGTLGNRPGGRFNSPNPGLGAETAWSLETGLIWARGGWRHQALVYQLDYDERIVSVLTGRTVEGREEVRSENAARARYRGLEVSSAGVLPGGLDLRAALNLTRGDERLSPGAPRTPANRVPPLNGSLRLRGPLDAGWAWDLVVIAAAEQDRLAPSDRRDSRIDPDGTPAWWRLDLGVHGRVAPGLRLQLRGENLLDRAYREHGSGIDAVGRNLVLTLDWSFGA